MKQDAEDFHDSRYVIFHLYTSVKMESMIYFEYKNTGGF